MFQAFILCYVMFCFAKGLAKCKLGGITSWEVWFGEPKSDNIVSLGVGRYKSPRQTSVGASLLTLLSSFSPLPP